MDTSLPSVFIAGVATLATPCILPMIPIYLSLLMGASLDSAKTSAAKFRLVGAASLFVLGFSVVFTTLGLGASTLGSVLAGHRRLLLIIGGLLIVGFGLKYLGVLKIGSLDRTFQIKKLETGSRLLDPFLFGVVFALGWTPCVGPILGSVLTYTAATTSSAAGGALYLFVYSLGVGIPLIVVSVVADRLVPKLRKLNKHLPKLEKATGVVMVVVGLVLVAPAAYQLAEQELVRGDEVALDMGVEPGAEALGLPSERPRLVEFYSEDCPVCQEMAPRFEQLKEDCVSKRIDVVTVDISDPRNSHLREQFGITAVPTVKLFARDGSVKGQLFGAHELEDLRAAAALLIEATCHGQEGKSEFVSTTAGCSTSPDRGSLVCDEPPPESASAASCDTVID